jgi:hypothetical protein
VKEYTVREIDWPAVEAQRAAKQETAARYQTLRKVLDAAYRQASEGKGHERHDDGIGFSEQPICEIGRLLSSTCDGELFQAIKKAQEASRMLTRDQHRAAVAELLGAINYLAAAVILIEERE